MKAMFTHQAIKDDYWLKQFIKIQWVFDWIKSFLITECMYNKYFWFSKMEHEQGDIYNDPTIAEQAKIM